MAFIITLILGSVLFILYKVVTSTNIPNLNVNINTSRKNSPNIKNSFNHTTNVYKSIHNNINVNQNNSSGSNGSDPSIVAFIALPIIAGLILFNTYKKYLKEINSTLIYSVLAIALIFIMIALFSKFRGTLTTNLIQYLLISFFALFVVVVFYFFPLYSPDNLTSLLSSQTPMDLPSLDSNIVAFIALQLIGSFGQIIVTLIVTIYTLRKFSDNQLKYSYTTLSIVTTICFISTSGILANLIKMI